MRRLAVTALCALALAACGGDPAEPAGGTPSTTPAAAPDEVFAETMDETAPGWREDFAVDGTDGSEPETLAILAAKTACLKLETMPVEDVLLSFLAGELPPETVGSLLYSATVAYCPDFTEAVQSFAETNR
ncbi:MAG: hypothetical protein H0V64_06850 [Geodermatophilaceae bacterium]|nr:hypothetical protein [Geodermatophilaceae bacterium]